MAVKNIIHRQFTVSDGAPHHQGSAYTLCGHYLGMTSMTTVSKRVTCKDCSVRQNRIRAKMTWLTPTLRRNADKALAFFVRRMRYSGPTCVTELDVVR